MKLSASNFSRPSTRSSFIGCFLGQGLAAKKALQTSDRMHPADKLLDWSHEVAYTHILAQNYIINGGKLDAASLRLAIDDGLAFERGLFVMDRGDQMIEHSFEDLCAKKKFRIKKTDHSRIGGPGLAAHILPAGLVHRNDIGAIIADSLAIGEMTHRYAAAIAGGTTVAIAIALAVTEGRNPEAIIYRLLGTLHALPEESRPTGIMMSKLEKIGRLYKEQVSTVRGIRALCRGQYLTANDVVPGAIFAALNGPLAWQSLMKALRPVGNYKFWAIAGAIRGAMIGQEGLPEQSVQSLIHHEDTIRNAAELYRATASS